jgi:short-subunit dehydrogenase
VSNPEALWRAADEVRCGAIDIWINNAMVTMFSPLSEMTFTEFRRITDVTYLGYVYGTMAALKHMRPPGSGTIIQIGSALSYRAIPLQSAYCGAKFAVRAFTDSLRSELRHEGSHIRLTMLQLPAVNTPQFDWARNRFHYRAQPLAPIFQPEAVAGSSTARREQPRVNYGLVFRCLRRSRARSQNPAFSTDILPRKATKGSLPLKDSQTLLSTISLCPRPLVTQPVDASAIVPRTPSLPSIRPGFADSLQWCFARLSQVLRSRLHFSQVDTSRFDKEFRWNHAPASLFALNSSLRSRRPYRSAFVGPNGLIPCRLTKNEGEPADASSVSVMSSVSITFPLLLLPAPSRCSWRDYAGRGDSESDGINWPRKLRFRSDSKKVAAMGTLFDADGFGSRVAVANF